LRAQMRAELIRLHTKLNATIVYVTHDQAEAMTMATRIAVMSKGHLAQVGTPQQIYDSPADLFVATFVGLPKMNVVTGRLGSVDNSPVLEVLGRTIRMDPASFVSPNSSSSAEVFVGIRPEDVLCDPGNPQDAIYGDVEVVEPLGSETLVTARCDETTTLVARVPPRTPIAIGDRIRIQINTQHLHLFDKTTQQSLLLPTTSGPVKTWQPEVFAEVRAN
jgi:multiple sugar transport system ATP-binding protein